MTTEGDLRIATEVIEEWRASGNIWKAAELIASTRDTDRATFRERYDLMRTIEQVRRLADEMDREDPQVSTRHIASRIRQALSEESA